MNAFRAMMIIIMRVFFLRKEETMRWYSFKQFSNVIYKK